VEATGVELAVEVMVAVERTIRFVSGAQHKRLGATMLSRPGCEGKIQQGLEARARRENFLRRGKINEAKQTNN
jgi:hypothetical protein